MISLKGMGSMVGIPNFIVYLSLIAYRTAFQGKIVGRGVLLDYWSYAKENGIHYSPVETHLITAEVLEACARAQKVTLEMGDILFIRMGYIDWYENVSEEERSEVLLKTYPSNYTGIRQERAEVEWFWCVLLGTVTPAENEL
jgi:hypothetical protein